MGVNIKAEILNLGPMVPWGIHQSPEVAYTMLHKCAFFLGGPQCSVIKESEVKRRMRSTTQASCALVKLNGELHPI